jgi:hypothetical protein
MHKDPPLETIRPESKLSGGEYVPLDTVVIEWSPLSSLNHMTVIPVGMEISAGSGEEIPVGLNGERDHVRRFVS